MKNKPIAWMIQKGNTKILFSEDPPNNLMQEFIPLYTHPAELTDEEIKDFIATFPIIFTPDDLVIFAKAILRKAQEK